MPSSTTSSSSSNPLGALDFSRRSWAGPFRQKGDDLNVDLSVAESEQLGCSYGAISLQGVRGSDTRPDVLAGVLANNENSGRGKRFTQEHLPPWSRCTRLPPAEEGKHSLAGRSRSASRSKSPKILPNDYENHDVNTNRRQMKLHASLSKSTPNFPASLHASHTSSTQEFLKSKHPDQPLPSPYRRVTDLSVHDTEEVPPYMKMTNLNTRLAGNITAVDVGRDGSNLIGLTASASRTSTAATGSTASKYLGSEEQIADRLRAREYVENAVSGGNLKDRDNEIAAKPSEYPVTHHRLTAFMSENLKKPEKLRQTPEAPPAEPDQPVEEDSRSRIARILASMDRVCAVVEDNLEGKSSTLENRSENRAGLHERVSLRTGENPISSGTDSIASGIRRSALVRAVESDSLSGSHKIPETISLPSTALDRERITPGDEEETVEEAHQRISSHIAENVAHAGRVAEKAETIPWTPSGFAPSTNTSRPSVLSEGQHSLTMSMRHVLPSRYQTSLGGGLSIGTTNNKLADNLAEVVGRNLVGRSAFESAEFMKTNPFVGESQDQIERKPEEKPTMRQVPQEIKNILDEMRRSTTPLEVTPKAMPSVTASDSIAEPKVEDKPKLAERLSAFGRVAAARERVNRIKEEANRALMTPTEEVAGELLSSGTDKEAAKQEASNDRAEIVPTLPLATKQNTSKITPMSPLIEEDASPILRKHFRPPARKLAAQPPLKRNPFAAPPSEASREPDLKTTKTNSRNPKSKKIHNPFSSLLIAEEQARNLDQLISSVDLAEDFDDLNGGNSTLAGTDSVLMTARSNCSNRSCRSNPFAAEVMAARARKAVAPRDEGNPFDDDKPFEHFTEGCEVEKSGNHDNAKNDVLKTTNLRDSIDVSKHRNAVARGGGKKYHELRKSLKRSLSVGEEKWVETENEKFAFVPRSRKNSGNWSENASVAGRSDTNRGSERDGDKECDNARTPGGVADAEDDSPATRCWNQAMAEANERARTEGNETAKKSVNSANATSTKSPPPLTLNLPARQAVSRKQDQSRSNSKKRSPAEDSKQIREVSPKQIRKRKKVQKESVDPLTSRSCRSIKSASQSVVDYQTMDAIEPAPSLFRPHFVLSRPTPNYNNVKSSNYGSTPGLIRHNVSRGKAPKKRNSGSSSSMGGVNYVAANRNGINVHSHRNSARNGTLISRQTVSSASKSQIKSAEGDITPDRRPLTGSKSSDAMAFSLTKRGNNKWHKQEHQRTSAATSGKAKTLTRTKSAGPARRGSSSKHATNQDHKPRWDPTISDFARFRLPEERVPIWKRNLKNTTGK